MQTLKEVRKVIDTKTDYYKKKNNKLEDTKKSQGKLENLLAKNI